MERFPVRLKRLAETMLITQDKLKPPTAQRWRWYDAALGRFVSADSLVPGAGNPQALNRFSYVVNNPVRLVDPSGNRPCGDGEEIDCDGRLHVNRINLNKGCGGPIQKPCGGVNVVKQRDYCRQRPFAKGCQADVQRVKQPKRPELPKVDKPSWVAGVSGSVCVVPNCGVLGVEVVGQEDPAGQGDNFAIYGYSGIGAGGPGGVSGSVYGGAVWNVEGPNDYAGKFNSVGFNFSVLDVGLTGSYFWTATTDDPFETGIVKGFVIGYSPGAQLSVWGMVTDYVEWFADWD